MNTIEDESLNYEVILTGQLKIRKIFLIEN